MTEVEAPFIGDVGVGIECYVRYRVAVPDEEFAAPQVPLHHPEGVVAEFSLRLERGPALLRHLHMVRDPEPWRRDVGFVAVLLEERRFCNANSALTVPSSSNVNATPPRLYHVRRLLGIARHPPGLRDRTDPRGVYDTLVAYDVWPLGCSA